MHHASVGGENWGIARRPSAKHRSAFSKSKSCLGVRRGPFREGALRVHSQRLSPRPQRMFPAQAAQSDASSPELEAENVATPLLSQIGSEGVGAVKNITLHYSTGWNNTFLHYSACGGDWRDLPLTRIGSGHHWCKAKVEVQGNDNGSPLLEFVMTNNEGEWDKPLAGGNYEIRKPGRFIVKHGDIEDVIGKPVMVVSDLDGTMVGDDEATKAFKNFWQKQAVVRGSVLVYSTGRSLQSFQELLREKRHCLNVPDVLVSSVGTKIYLNNGQGEWQEDQGWVATLDRDWNLNAVREAAYSALAEAGTDNMHFRPPEEQNEHKVTCGVNVSVLDKVVAHIQKALDANNAKAKLISSGMGEWRYLDLVSNQAGKLESLDYVRKSYGFDKESTIACGDSGNDILMLSGKNRAIVVGNAQPDLKDWVETQLGNGDSPSRLWVATKHEAYGILEGLQHFGFK
ncbi:hypothetical protein BSKO_06399 [Bryopsis sp. KO-2023]|nr:hypothetical protein BSKO_06399 [Bryopsis sp. KO-2023]